MNYRKYRTAASRIFTIPFLTALIAAGVYAALTYFDFIEAPFEWEYLAALGGVHVHVPDEILRSAAGLAVAGVEHRAVGLQLG